MPLSVISFCSYLANINFPWRQQDWDAYKFVHAVKGHKLNGYASVPVRGVSRRLNNANLESAIDWFADMVADYLTQKKINPPFLLVPVPDSGSTLASGARSHTVRLARAIAQEIGSGVDVFDCFRWKRNLGSASKGGGPRDAATLYQNLSVTKKVESGRYILVDDVLTSGGHLQACAARLKEKAATILMAVCAGRTVYVQPRNAFAPTEETLTDYKP